MMTFLKQTLKTISLLILLAPCAYGQIAYYTEQAIQPVNVTSVPQPVFGPIPFASFRVCSLPLTQTSPCLPLATITDQFGNTLSNSIGGNFGQSNADNTGRITFGCTTGTNYQLQYSGASNTPQGNHPISCGGNSGGLTAGQNIPFTGNNTHGGAETFAQLNGCQYVSANQTLPQAIADVSNPGCILVSASYALAANATIPSGITLVFQGNGSLTTTGFTLTINGPIVAPPVQIFFGTGTVALGSSNPIRAIWFPGTDFHAKLQAAYNAGPTTPSAFKIYADPNPAGGCWTTTTSASLNTSQKYAQIIVEAPTSPNVPQQGFCDNFTPTITGAAVSISAISDSANLVTVTCSATCTSGWTGGGGSTATIVTVRGVTVPDYNGVWPVQTVTDGTHFTYNASIGAPSSSSGGTVAQSPYAIELDWTPAGGGGYDPTSGMVGYVLDNAGCSTTGGCGNYSIGLLLARTNAGLHAATMMNNSFHGFGTAIAKINSTNCQTGWGTNFINNSMMWNNVGMFIGCANENDTWTGGGKVAVNGTGFVLAGFGAELTYQGGSFDSQTICGVQMDAGSIWHSTDLHYENLGVSNSHYACGTAGNSLLDIKGGIVYDDTSTSTTDYYFQAGIINAKGVFIHSNGRTISGGAAFNANTFSDIDVSSDVSTIPFTSLVPNLTASIVCATINGGAKICNTPIQNYPETTAPSVVGANNATCYADSTAHALKCSYNNDAFNKVARTGGALIVGNAVKSDANGNLVDSGAPPVGFTCVNIVPVTTTGGSTTNDQNIQSCTIPAGTLNSVGKTLMIQTAGIYSTPAASTTAVNIKVKLCSVAGCGSGNVATLLNISSAALGAIQATNDPFNIVGMASTQTGGVTSAAEAHGNLTIDISALATAAEGVYADGNTGTVAGTPSAIDLTAQNFLQISVAFTSASASNVATGRQLVVDVVD